MLVWSSYLFLLSFEGQATVYGRIFTYRNTHHTEFIRAVTPKFQYHGVASETTAVLEQVSWFWNRSEYLIGSQTV